MENLGKKGKDRITGFEGIITGKCYYLYGCAQYSLNPKVDKDGNTKEINWFDIGRIEIISDGISKDAVQVEDDPGCEFNDHP